MNLLSSMLLGIPPLDIVTAMGFLTPTKALDITPKTCRVCGETKPAHKFRMGNARKGTTSRRRKNTCTACEYQQAKARKK